MITKRWLTLAATATSCAIIASCCCCCDAFAPPLDGNILLRSPPATASTTTRVYLFDLKQRLENQQRSAEQQLSRSRIPEEEIYYLSRGFGFSTEEGDNNDPLELPYTIDLTTSPTRISPTTNESKENQAAA